VKELEKETWSVLLIDTRFVCFSLLLPSSDSFLICLGYEEGTPKARMALGEQGRKKIRADTMTLIQNMWNKCPKCNQTFTGEMRIGLTESWWSQVGDHEEKDPVGYMGAVINLTVMSRQIVRNFKFWKIIIEKSNNHRMFHTVLWLSRPRSKHSFLSLFIV
jgi:hypothetical protein